MAQSRPKSLAFGGVNDVAHPLAFPITRSVRCKNWVPKPNGRLQLRYGWTQPSMDTSSSSNIHTAAYYETWVGAQYILFSQSTTLKRLDIQAGTVTSVATLSNASRWGHFRANNYIYLSNGTDFKSYDGSTLRNAGVRAPLYTDFASVSTTAFGSTVTESGSGVSWNSLSNVLASDNAYATASLTPLSSSKTIKMTDISAVALPAGAIPVGIEAKFEINVAGEETFINAQLIKNGSLAGTAKTQVTSVSSDTTVTLGSPTDLWDALLSRTDINGTQFGISAYLSVESGGTATRSIDALTLTVYYTTAVSVSATTATAGSFSTTTLSGYQLYLAYYNPTTGEVGNRLIVGSRITVAGSGYSLVATGLPDLSGVDTEWVKILGRTPDGGEVPYWFIDQAGDFITVGNAATVATIVWPDVDYDSELPTRNTVGSGFTAFAKVGGRIFAIKANDNYIYYSEDEADAVSGIFVGIPAVCWPANNAEAFPTGEVPIAIHEYGREGWFFSKNHLIRWRESLRLQLVEPWVGPWPVGCGGQRLFVATPHGPFWIDGNKRLRTFTSDGPVEVSNEYQRTLLSRIADDELSDAEMVWEYDQDKEIDRLRILGTDSTGAPVEIIHDFLLQGQGYEESHASTLTTLVGSGYSPFVPVRDSDGKRQSWAGLSTGRFAQLNGGTSDNGATYTADYISGPVWTGDEEPLLAELDFIGDNTIVVSHSFKLTDTLTDFESVTFEEWDTDNSINKVKIGQSAQFHRFRFQLTSHPTDGDFDVDEPYQTPLNTYGQIHAVGFGFGAGRKEAR